MSDTNLIILNMLMENKSMKEISSELNITLKQLYVRIRQIINSGYNLTPAYGYSSNIYYDLLEEQIENKNEVTIEMLPHSNEFRCLVVSDNHIGNIDADMDLMKRVYEYAAKNNINIIFNCGDLIEGTRSSERRIIKDDYQQMEYFVKNHPYDKNINNFVILGNHDVHPLHYNNIDFLEVLKKYRYDIIPLGYGQGIVNIKDDSILLEHDLSVVENPNLKNNARLVLVGHGHLMRTKIYEQLQLCVPNLSYVSTDKNKQVIPGFIDMNINLEKGKFEYLQARHLILSPQILEVSQIKCRFNEVYRVKNKAKKKDK